MEREREREKESERESGREGKRRKIEIVKEMGGAQ